MFISKLVFIINVCLLSAIVTTAQRPQYTKQMPLKVKTESKQVLKTLLNLTDHARLIQYGEDIGMTKREAGAKILREFLRKNVKLEIDA